MQFSLPQKKCPFTFQKKWKKRLKFKYETFNGSDFLKTAFMVCYRFLGRFFLWGALLKRQETFSIGCVEFFFFPKTAAALVKFHQIT